MFDIFVLSLVQGITEFLPISSSIHLTLCRSFLGLSPSKGLDVVLHGGSLLAILIFLRVTLWNMIQSLWRKDLRPFWHKAWQVVIATIPSIIVGFLIHQACLDFRMSVAGWCSIIFGITLYCADKFRPSENSLTYTRAFLIGLVQSLAFLPGASRLGTSLTAARLLGIPKAEAVNFSLLLSIPVILGAFVLMAKDIVGFISIPMMVTGMSLTTVFGILTMNFLIDFLVLKSLVPLMIYRVALGIYLLSL